LFVTDATPPPGMPASDSGRFGKAVEHLVAASCILASGGELNVSTALVDDEGVDAVFHRRDHSSTLAVQIKSRSMAASLLQRGQFQAFVRGQTFRPRPNLHLLFVAVNAEEGTYDIAWLVPSAVLAQRMRPGTRGRLRFRASMKPDSQDQWRPLRLTRAELPDRILGLLAELESQGA
jgi:hypothetical protein